MGEVPAAAAAATMPLVQPGSMVSEIDAFLSLGTSGGIFAATGGFRPNADRAVHAFCHCLPQTWRQIAVHPLLPASIGRHD